MSTPPSPDPFSPASTPSFNGYHLLNEVSTGGTLSSLFSILSLFTEDIKLSWSHGPDPHEGSAGPSGGSQDDEEHEEVVPGRPAAKSRTNSDVSQLGEGIEGKDVPLEGVASRVPIPGTGRPSRPRSISDSSPASQHRGSMSSGGDDTTVRESASEHEDGDAGDTTFKAQDFAQPDLLSPSSTSQSRRSSPSSTRGRSHSHSFRPESTRPLGHEDGLPRRRRGKAVPGLGPTALNGTIARATVDTTLAVIPAEAFRKLTRKFPKASGTIVQVVLERFSRVTFMTGMSLIRPWSPKDQTWLTDSA